MEEAKKEVPVEPKKEVFKFDANTVLAVLYLYYKTNLITRQHLRTMLAEVKKEWPEDMAKYLVKEANE